jgi:hypothetical protein
MRSLFFTYIPGVIVKAAREDKQGINYLYVHLDLTSETLNLTSEIFRPYIRERKKAERLFFIHRVSV